MSANAKFLQIGKVFRSRDVSVAGHDKQRNFFGTRRWETSCEGDFQTGDTPDRLVFVISLLLLPFILII